ncbi:MULTISPECIES: hypothetical protein [Streptomyces]|uniref:Uncharacterized protein n=1 Tax=Streptomyces koelreuteriae TaxID=2838015 RepID=A0ABX8FT95_9ACTN|nr:MULTISPECIES: hypothetical protein [Streptomyces]QWB24433.1 hypothetical protein KJK29_18555 [Streptomyces koelreuteriae]UUA07438.1 hypothetical protein NNW98_18660 [Streptomyces koelreuteriae]UUA15067.1 hypothetical protein NNW99_18655 [Streptomyces sp. CRCS-T-1]
MTDWNKSLRPERFAFLAGLAVMGVALLFLLGATGIVVAAVVGVLCLGAVAGGRSGVRAVRARRWGRPGTWLTLGAACVSTGVGGFAVAYLTGILSGGLDVEEACVHGHGVSYDDAYREAHAQEFNRWFPLSSKCNENFDLVPAWVNPALVFFALLAAIGVLCLAAAVVTALRPRRDR